MTNSDSDNEEGGEQFLNNLFKNSSNGDIYVYEIMVRAMHAGKTKRVNTANMSNIWRIGMKAAKQTLGVTTQNSKHTNES